ncbi:hypothetical protein Tco_0020463 [Tanacetum coccineum]
MSKNDMKNRICTLSKNDLKDLVKTYYIPLDLHPRLPDPGFTMDHLPDNATGIYTEFLWFFGIRLNKVVSFEVVCRDLNIVPTVTLFRVFQCLCKKGDGFSFSKCRNTEDVCMYDGPSSLKKWMEKFFLIDRRAILDYLTWRHSCSSVLDDLPTDGYDQSDVERLCAHLIYLREMREEARVHSASVTAPEPGQPSKKRRLRKRSSEAGSSALELGQAKGVDEADLTDFYAKIENSMERDEGTSARASLTPTPHLDKRLGVVVSGYAGKSGAEVLWHQVDSLDSLARSALAHDVEYDWIPKDDFGTATRGEEIDLTLFPLTPGPFQMSYPYKGASSPPYTREEYNGGHAPEGNLLCKDIFKDLDVCQKALDQTITPAELKRTEYLLPLDLANCFNVLSALLVFHGAELNSHYTGLVSDRNHLQEKFDRKVGYVKVLRSEVTDLDGKLKMMQKDCDALVQENRELCSQKDVASVKVKELQTELTDVRVASIGLSEELSQGYKDAIDDLREEVTQFISSGMGSLVQKLLSSDEFHAALACVASLGINYGVERGLRMGRTDVEFEAAIDKVSNFHVRAKADFDKGVVDFPTTPFPFLNKIVMASRGTLSEVTQVFPDKHIRSVIPASIVPSIVNEDADQVLLEHTFGASTASI